MPAKKIDGDGRTSTSPTRPSNCSERLRTNRGQCAAPGISDLSAAHHLAAVAHAEREAVARARRTSANCSPQSRVEQDRLRPALAGAEHVAVGEAAAGDEPVELVEPRRGPRSGRSCARRPARIPRGGTPPPSRAGCSRPARAGSRSRAARPSARSAAQRCPPRDRTSGARTAPDRRDRSRARALRRAQAGLSRSDCMRKVVSDHARRNSVRVADEHRAGPTRRSVRRSGR